MDGDFRRITPLAVHITTTLFSGTRGAWISLCAPQVTQLFALCHNLHRLGRVVRDLLWFLLIVVVDVLLD